MVYDLQRKLSSCGTLPLHVIERKESLHKHHQKDQEEPSRTSNYLAKDSEEGYSELTDIIHRLKI
jgi:hypothetical protein